MSDRRRHNFWAIGLDFIFFAVALQFFNPTTTLPAFANRLMGSAAFVGVVATFFDLMWAMPQLVAGNFVSRFDRKKPVLITATLIGRPIVLLLAVLILVTGGTPAWLVIGAMFFAIAAFLGTDGFAAVAWFDILGRAFPSKQRGKYISFWQVGKGILVIGVAALVRYLLGPQGPPFPTNYALIFGAGGLALVGSFISISQIHEPPPAEGEITKVNIPWREFATFVVNIWQSDKSFRRVTLARMIFLFSLMARPFYVIYATDVLDFPEQTIGLFIAAQTIGTLIASLGLGQIAERFGERSVVLVGTVIILTAPVVAMGFALLGGDGGWLRFMYGWIYICIGLADNLIILGHINYALTIAPEGKRTIYMGATNAIASLGAFGPFLAGYYLTLTSYPVLFVTSLVLGLISLVLAWRMPPAREPT